jgi:hypothetical protein
MPKSEKMEKFLEDMAMKSFGRSRKSPYCVACGSPFIMRQDFRDELSWKEFNISRYCQKCQDGVFNGEEE